jgi:hypothetical protein
VPGFDDYQDEMDRLGSDEIEAILTGREVEDAAAARMASMLEELREALAAPPSDESASRHLLAMKAAASETRSVVNLRSRRIGMKELSRRRVVLLAAAAALLVGGGISAALTLPEQADDTAVERVENLPADPAGPPEGDPSGGASEHGTLVSGTARDDGMAACEQGQAVSNIASSMAQEPRQSPVDPCAQAEEAGLPAVGGGGGGGGTETAGGGGGSGGSGSGGGGGGGGTETAGGGGGGSGGSDSGGGGGGGGTETAGGGGGGSGGSGSGGGSGGGGTSQGSGGAPEGLPTP